MKKFRTDEEMSAILASYRTQLRLKAPFLVETTKGPSAKASRIEHCQTADGERRVLFLVTAENAFEVFVSSGMNSISDDHVVLNAMIEIAKDSVATVAAAEA